MASAPATRWAASSLKRRTIKNGDESAYKDTATKYTFTWYDGAVQASIIYDKERSHEDDPYTYGLVQGGTLASFTNDFQSDFYYNGFGQLSSAYVGDGMAKNVTFTNDENGQIIRRDETRPTNAPAAQTGSPHEVWIASAGARWTIPSMASGSPG